MKKYSCTETGRIAEKNQRRLVLLTALIFLCGPYLPRGFSETCLACHGNPKLSKTVDSGVISLFTDRKQLDASVHAAIACSACHVGLDATRIPHAKIIPPVRCQSCHAVKGFDESVHNDGMKRNGAGKAAGIGCSGCHGTHSIRSSGDPASSTSRGKISETCGDCHRQALSAFRDSAHHAGYLKGVEKSPSCIDCHGSHDIVPLEKPESPLYRQREPDRCLACHLRDDGRMNESGVSDDSVAGYKKSVHGVGLSSGNMKSASCSDCHGSHDLKFVRDPSSSVSRQNLTDTCASCHPEVSEAYRESIHGVAVQKGNEDAPTCADCHGKHGIAAVRDPLAATFGKNITEEVCAACHDSVRITGAYGIASDRFKTFYDSRHGLLLREGRLEAINCASCHGVHNIKPSSDPDSLIHPSNIPATCGGCHTRANENFARGDIHMPPPHDPDSGVLYWIRAVYIFLIISVVGGMVIHNLFDFIRKIRYRLAVRRGKIESTRYGSTRYIRMTLVERIQHAVMSSSFILLALTGFMIRYPDAWWVAPFRHLSDNFFELRIYLHKIAAAVIIAVCLWHVIWMFTTARGKQFRADIVPVLKDAVDAWKNLLHLMGFSKFKPLFGRFRYIEKIEYWAVVWGMVIMSVSGIIMWFHDFFMGTFTKLGLDIARTVHFYEACLAGLAIAVWHFYYVMLNPDVYPMNTAWITGKISESELAKNHPLELERLKKRD